MVLGATITRGLLPAFAGKAGRQPFPLLCLAPHGVFRAISAYAKSGGLLPRLFTLTQHHLASARHRSRNEAYRLVSRHLVQDGAGRYIFCDTFRYPGLTLPGRPRFHGACCLSVFGLSSGKISVKPAITCHGRKIAWSGLVPVATRCLSSFEGADHGCASR